MLVLVPDVPPEVVPELPPPPDWETELSLSTWKSEALGALISAENGLVVPGAGTSATEKTPGVEALSWAAPSDQTIVLLPES